MHDRPTVARPAATVILLRGGAQRLEVLLVQRTPRARFMGGMWVFPGGALDPADGDGDDAHRRAAVREVAEEASIALDDPASLVPFAHWITPEAEPIRFDTWFYLAPAPRGQAARVDGEEVVDARWFAPAGALAGHAAGEIPLAFPTIRTLEQLAEFVSADALLASAAGREIPARQPRIVGSRIVLDDDG